MSGEDLVRSTQERFGSKAVFACSFGAEDMVVLDMIARLPDSGRGRIRVVSLDTGRLFSETYDLIERARSRYSLPIELVFPDAAEVEQMVNEKGPNLFYGSIEDRKRCCTVRKVRPLDRALHGAEAWIVGLRREQSAERSVVPKVSVDAAHSGIYKISPLADWTSEEVLAYVRRYDVPVNELHARGFVSIGCAPCTRAVPEGRDPRSGRWWWETGTKECGLHSVEAPSVGAVDPPGLLVGSSPGGQLPDPTSRDLIRA